MSILRKVLVVLLLILIVFVAAIFAYSNPEPINVDVGIMRFEGVSMALAFACAFALGWLFGLLSVGIAVVRMAAERHRLKRELRYAASEISTLRSLPMHDAN